MSSESRLTEAQHAVLERFKTDFPETTNQTALRFALARKFDYDRVKLLYQNYQDTIKRYHLEQTTIGDVLSELRTKKLYVPGTRAKNGSALFIVNAKQHIPGVYAMEDTLRLAFWYGEKVTQDSKTQKSGICLISNMEGVEWANFDNVFQRKIIEFFQNNIPAAVKHILLYKAPWWVSMVVKMVSPFLKEKMRARIRLCEEGQLEEFVSKDELPAELGGTFEYDHEYFIRQELKKAGPIHGSQLQGLGTVTEEKLPEPPGTMHFFSSETEAALQKERKKTIRILDEKLRLRRKSMEEHTLPMEILLLIGNTRKTRMSLDVDSLIMPNPQPNVRSHVIPYVPMGPISGEHQEDTAARIEAQIRQDRQRSLQEQGSRSTGKQDAEKEDSNGDGDDGLSSNASAQDVRGQSRPLQKPHDAPATTAEEPPSREVDFDEQAQMLERRRRAKPANASTKRSRRGMPITPELAKIVRSQPSIPQ